jgi:hypothetical protein
MSFEPTQQPMPYSPGYGTGYGTGPQPGAGPAAPPRRRRRPVRWTVISLFIVVVAGVLLFIGDWVGRMIAENDMASQFTANGFPVKPSVSIEGFPFLTQLAERDFRQVDISAANVPAGPVTITSLHTTLTGMHLSSSWNGATIDQISATAFVSFGALAAAGDLGGTGVTAVPSGPDRLKITADLGGVVSASLQARVLQTGPRQITIKVLDNGGISSLLSSFGSYSFSLPAGVPPSLRITGLTLSPAGLTVTASAAHATFSEPPK